MAEYLQMYLDETSEQLDALVETLLALEVNPTDADQLNEAFRLVHSIKGSSALMGLDSVTVLTHQLENHFERLRSGLQRLDRSMMDLILRCIDFLRECNRRMRAGQELGSAPELLEQLNSYRPGEPELKPAKPAAAPLRPTVRTKRDYHLSIRFEAGMPLPDLKAELVLARLADVSSIRATRPARSDLGQVGDTGTLEILLSSERSADEVRSTADVSGVELIEVEEGVTEFPPEQVPIAPEPEPEPEPVLVPAPVEAVPPPPPVEAVLPPAAEPEEEAHEELVGVAAVAEPSESKAKVGETVRVDIERLDNLMNLAGELVVNKARFVQIARQMSPAFKKSSLSARARTFGESMRRALQSMKAQNGYTSNGEAAHWMQHLHELEAEVYALEEQSRLWEESRRYFGQITEAIDQLTRVSDSLQRGVLDTRMVPVAPLFNRFKRVVRDIANELQKRVQLEIRGEKTELDKRMIDELGDPLVHLVRNSIDHGIESAAVRAKRGKPEVGKVYLEAAHSGNNVYISVRDDGGGIDVEKIRRRIVERGLIAASAAEPLGDRDLVEYIWHPGFSTADVVSGISGRGVGMDIVKTRIAELNGTIDIQNAPGQGTTFTIRLPLTLAIIRSLLFRLRHGVFAVPIDNVREIVSVPVDEIITIHGKQTFEVRGEFIPLVDINDVFEWHTTHYDYAGYGGYAGDTDGKRIDVVILHAAGKTMGLKVNELHGGQDIVIKSLAENFVHIRGLSGASILGDGSVCLLLDVGAAIDMASGTRKASPVT